MNIKPGKGVHKHKNWQNWINRFGYNQYFKYSLFCFDYVYRKMTMVQLDLVENWTELWTSPKKCKRIAKKTHKICEHTTRKCFKFPSQAISCRKPRARLISAPKETAILTNSSSGRTRRGTLDDDLQVHNKIYYRMHLHSLNQQMHRTQRKTKA